MRGQFGLSYNNLFGRAKRLDGLAKVSLVGERWEGTYTDPRLLISDFRLSVTGFVERREEVSFDVRKIGSLATLRYPFQERAADGTGREVGVEALWRTEFSEVLALSPGVSAADRNIFLRSLGAAASVDSRDDIAWPRMGLLARAGVEHAGGPFGGGADFTRVRASAFYYLPLPSGPLPGGAALALGVRGGTIRRHSGARSVPLQERFFTGGESSVRGYKEKELGPSEAGAFVGGESLWVMNAEVRVPTPLPYLPRLGTSFFYDEGNVGPRYNGLDLADLRSSVGTGLHYQTPVGPIRADWAQKLDREPGEPASAIHLSVGFAF